jgi:hypothetical protein
VKSPFFTTCTGPLAHVKNFQLFLCARISFLVWIDCRVYVPPGPVEEHSPWGEPGCFLTNVVLAVIQVLSRLWALWGLVNLAPDATTKQSVVLIKAGDTIFLQLNFISLMICWCCSEVLRYSFYVVKVNPLIKAIAPVCFSTRTKVAPGAVR